MRYGRDTTAGSDGEAGTRGRNTTHDLPRTTATPTWCPTLVSEGKGWVGKETGEGGKEKRMEGNGNMMDVGGEERGWYVVGAEVGKQRENNTEQ